MRFEVEKRCFASTKKTGPDACVFYTITRYLKKISWPRSQINEIKNAQVNPFPITSDPERVHRNAKVPHGYVPIVRKKVCASINTWLTAVYAPVGRPLIT